MDVLIYVLVGIAAVAVLLEAIKRAKSSTSKPAKSKASDSEESGPYISADEEDPTQTGRMRAMHIKQAIRGEADGTQKPSTGAQLKKGGHTAIDHEKVDANESGGFDLPDPFTVDIAEDKKE